MRYPLSFAQQQLWDRSRVAPGDPAAHLARAWWLEGVLDPVALQRAVDVVVTRHPVLRSTFDGAEQVVDDAGRVVVDHVVAGAPEAEAVVAELAARPFDPARGPLLRSCLVEVAPDRWLFALVAHRLVLDEAALGVLLDELSAAYRRDAASLPELWMDYGDFAVWQRERLRGAELARQVDHWREPLRGASFGLALPTGGAAGTVTAVLDPVSDVAVLTGYAVVLSRYARQSDVVVGVVVDGRVRAELEPVVGPFADVVPVRLSVGGTFAELLDRVREATEDALAHDELPLAKLAEELGFDADLTARFDPRPSVAATVDLPGAVVSGRLPLPPSVEADVDLGVGRDGTLALRYRADAAFADRLLCSLVTVLEHAARAPGTPVAELPLGEGPLPVGAPPVELDVVAALRESTATVTDRAGAVPVPEVCDRAARLARVLVERGVGPGTRVGVCVGRGVGLLTALLGVWWAGGATVALEPDLPLRRLEVVARTAGLGLVVADDEHAGLAGSIAGDVAVVVPDEAAEPREPVPVPADAVAYTAFTSTPDGPAGVDVTRGALANLLAVLRRDLGLSAGDRFAAVTTTSFDLVLPELLLPAVCGADLVVVAADEAREAGRLRSLLARDAVTALHATPETWRLLVSGGGVPEGVRLRLGTGLSRELADSLTAPGVAVWRLYGHPETAVWAAAGTDGLVPVDGNRVRVLDERSVPVPVGAVGEVHVSGVGVARGGFATGDLGRWREDGSLELLGRTDRRVVVRGARVDCGEVEAVLLAHRAVRGAAVVGVPRDGGTALVAYVVPDPDARAGTDLPALLRPHLSAVLPEPGVPALVVVLPELPPTRAGLPEPDWGAARADLVPPRGPVEEEMARIWAELLRTTEPIGVHDNLFALGAGSLTAIRFASRVADTYGVNLPVHLLVATPTIAAFAGIVSAELGQAPAEDPADDPADELGEMSDEELDDLLRAVLAARDRRRSTRGDG
ncbi:condensation domain-containing protein [Saccharothrix syringae]|uniref:Carrier domain-containing protein n=1 Tax=Saccharothrix syringae TaxID=103733 RepID=A0A5Q0H679_SACSY|nr:condensation domain-containing protein [Saccharothrix syringae]QFZ21222.1 hypothetical protein EKG83_30975 [Saccharothrix syringae]